MIIQTLKYIDASDLFDGCPEVWDIFCNSEPDCSWGDNSHTTVTKTFLLNHLDTCNGLSNQLKTVIERLESIADDVYINLEG